MIYAAATLAAIGGMITLFAGRKQEMVWLATVTALVVGRVADILLFTRSDAARLALSLVAAALAVGVMALLYTMWPQIPRGFLGFLSGIYTAAGALALFAPGLDGRGFAAIVAGGAVAGAVLLAVRDDLVAVPLSAVAGASMLTPLLSAASGSLASREALVFVSLASLGIGVQALTGGFAHGEPRTYGIRWYERLALPIALALALGAAGLVAARPMIDRAQPGDVAMAADTTRPPMPLGPADRVLVVSPHPDDETLACGGLIAQCRENGVPVRVAFVTGGDYNETSFAAYRKTIDLTPAESRRLGATRHSEALAALGRLGVPEEAVTFLGYPDEGTLEVWLRHWGTRAALRAPITDAASVPYAFARTPGAPYKGDSVLADLTAVMEEFRPTVVVVSHPGDVHPDHEAAYLFSRVAAWEYASRLQAPEPRVYGYLVHYGAFPGSRGYRPLAKLQPPAHFDVGGRWVAVTLQPDQVARKRAALHDHTTQMTSGGPFLESFVRQTEPFDPVPDLRLRAGEPPVASPVDVGWRSAAAASASKGRKAYVDARLQDIRLDGTTLELTVTLDRRLPTGVGLVMFAEGYSPGRFAGMPKLSLQYGRTRPMVQDQGRKVAADGISVTRDRPATTYVFRVPLASLGDPERVIVGGKVLRRGAQLDGIAWTVVSVDARP